MKVAKSPHKGRGKTGLKRRPANSGMLESAIVDLAVSGELAKASQLAIRRLKRKGLPVTFQRGTQIVKQYSDGREEVLAQIKQASFKVPSGVTILGAK
ncbi:MAG TPA: hypothetical protein VGN88_01230 [Phycisphaerae bacterium]